jgi:hypothetical protein
VGNQGFSSWLLALIVSYCITALGNRKPFTRRDNIRRAWSFVNPEILLGTQVIRLILFLIINDMIE